MPAGVDTSLFVTVAVFVMVGNTPLAGAEDGKLGHLIRSDACGGDLHGFLCANEGKHVYDGRANIPFTGQLSAHVATCLAGARTPIRTIIPGTSASIR